MKKFELPSLPYLIPIAIIAAAVAMLSIISINTWTHSNATPIPSYTAENLEALKAAQPNDLLLCVVENGTDQPTIQRAIIVESSSVERVVGYSLDQYSIRKTTVNHPYFGSCDLRLLRPGKTVVVESIMANIILYGLNPKPQAN